MLNKKIDSQRFTMFFIIYLLLLCEKKFVYIFNYFDSISESKYSYLPKLV